MTLFFCLAFSTLVCLRVKQNELKKVLQCHLVVNRGIHNGTSNRDLDNIGSLMKKLHQTLISTASCCHHLIPYNRQSSWFPEAGLNSFKQH